MRFLIWRRQRSRWIRGEFYDHDGVTFVNLMIGNPQRHAWWAFSAYLYLRGGR